MASPLAPRQESNNAHFTFCVTSDINAHVSLHFARILEPRSLYLFASPSSLDKTRSHYPPFVIILPGPTPSGQTVGLYPCVSRPGTSC